MTTISFAEWILQGLVEEIHPELDHTIKNSPQTTKHTQIAKKIKELTSRGEKTGLEGNQPKGSSRMWLTHEEPKAVTIDGHATHMKVGSKVVMKAALDKHRDKDKYPDSLGTMQNRDENGDHFVNNHHRVLSEDHDKSTPSHKVYKTNEHGIFPPLVDHDHENHQWSEIGHTRDLKAGDFKKLTKTKSHPEGITHKDFTEALEREHDRAHGKYWKRGEYHEQHLDHVTEHPLVQNFLDYHSNFAAPPHDYRQRKNLGVWKHPVTGKEHIVARDHGFSSEVMHAYADSRKRMARG